MAVSEGEDVKRAVNFQQVDARGTRRKEGQGGVGQLGLAQQIRLQLSDDGTRASATGYGDCARREPAIDRNVEVGSQAFHQDIVIYGKDPERRIFPDQGHDACEVGKSVLKDVPVRHLTAVERERHDLGEPGVQAVIARAARVACACDVLGFPLA